MQSLEVMPPYLFFFMVPGAMAVGRVWGLSQHELSVEQSRYMALARGR